MPPRGPGPPPAQPPPVAGPPPGAAAAQGEASARMVYGGQAFTSVLATEMPSSPSAMGNGSAWPRSPQQPQPRPTTPQQGFVPYPPLQPLQQPPAPNGARQLRQLAAAKAECYQDGRGAEQLGGSSGSGSCAGKSPAPPPQPQTLTQFQSQDGFCRVFWTVDARKLRGNDKGAVSPPFEFSFGEQAPHVTFKLLLYPKVVNDAKGGSSFKRAHGRGCVQLKCEEGLPTEIAGVSYRIAIGSSSTSATQEPRGPAWQEPRGPGTHNFCSNAVCGLSKEQEEWDFSSVVDADSQTFVVCLEMVIHHLARGKSPRW